MSSSARGREYQTLMRDRLIESRLTPNAISLTGFGLRRDSISRSRISVWYSRPRADELIAGRCYPAPHELTPLSRGR